MKTYHTRRNTEPYQTMEYQNELHKNPHIEVLYSDPPQLRVNGKIIPWPQGKTPEEAYQDYLERESKPVPLNQLSEEEPYPAEEQYFVRQQEHSLHPLRQQYLQDRLKQLDYLDRQQTRQDDFTTRMYGKKDFSEEKEKIKSELYSHSQQSNRVSINENSKKYFQPTKNDSSNAQTKPEKEIPDVIQKAINDYKQAHPQEYQQERLQIDREKAAGGSFKTRTLEEWQQKDKEYQKAKKSHCNTAVGSLLKEKGIDWPADKEMNDIINYMDKSSEWEKIPRQENGRLDHKTANDLAAAGETVVVTQKNPTGHGHSALLTGNNKMETSKNWLDEKGERTPIPEVKGSVGAAPIKTQHLGWHLTQQVEDQMDYYRYKKVRFE